MQRGASATWLGALALFSLPLALGIITMHASSRRRARAADEARLLPQIARLPTSDLALSGGARWLRSLSTEEPWAAFADAPAIADPDPAGGVVAPPREVWTRATGVRDVRITRGGAKAEGAR